MSIILVADVFGVTPALLKISKELGACSIVDPYKGEIMGFSSEADAYSCFIETVGLDNYFASLLKEVDSFEHKVTLIGFSVGATAIWRLSQNRDDNLIKQAFCFYGSQIRNFTQIEPCFKINLIFPKIEPHFDVVELQVSLSRKNNVKTEKVDYLHGFMNYYSNNYSEIGYTEHIDLLSLIAN